MDKAAAEAFIQDHNNSETVSSNSFVWVYGHVMTVCRMSQSQRPLDSVASDASSHAFNPHTDIITHDCSPGLMILCISAVAGLGTMRRRQKHHSSHGAEGE